MPRGLGIERERLVAHDSQTELQGLLGQAGMRVGRRRDGHCLDAGIDERAAARRRSACPGISRATSAWRSGDEVMTPTSSHSGADVISGAWK